MIYVYSILSKVYCIILYNIRYVVYYTTCITPHHLIKYTQQDMYRATVRPNVFSTSAAVGAYDVYFYMFDIPCHELVQVD